jgi:hypothetical protein
MTGYVSSVPAEVQGSLTFQSCFSRNFSPGNSLARYMGLPRKLLYLLTL